MARSAKSVEIREADEVRAIARKLIADHHPHLEEATIRYLFTNQTRRKCDKVRLGSTQKLSPIMRYLTSGENRSVEDGADFIILVGENEWTDLEPDQRRAMVDHELEHCGYEEDDEGNTKWVIRGHDVEEFAAVITRHGLWSHDLQRIGDVVDQLRLPLR